MNRKILTSIVLILAILVAIITRGYKLGTAPAGLYLDEAGQGYSAYSILKTGKDEFGKSFPIVFRSFTDFKTPIYIYLIVPLINIFGLTPFTVRFPSFLFSILTIPVLFFLIKELLPQKIYKKYFILNIVAVILLAISPWHILFGRTNFECNVALFFFLTGCLLFFKALKKPWVLIFSALFFAIAIPAYHAQRVVTPLTLLFLFIRYKNILLAKTHLKYLIVSGVIGLIITIPTLSIAATPGFLARAGLNIFSYKTPAGIIENYHGILLSLVNNHLFLSIQEFTALYVSYFSPRNIFLLGDSGPRSSFPELATFFVWQFPFFVIGLYKLIKNKDLGELKPFTIAFLLIAPIPAALTRDPYSTIRSLQMVIPLIIIISLGIVSFGNSLKKYNILLTGLVIYSLLKLYSSTIILNEYYRGRDWNYGWQEASNIINTLNQELPVIVDDSRDEPYIQLAFFLKANPITFQKENYEVPLPEYYTNLTRNKEKIIDSPNGIKITTRGINWEKDLLVKQYLIGDELAISTQQIKEHNLTLIKELKYENGEVAIRIVSTNPKLK